MRLRFRHAAALAAAFAFVPTVARSQESTSSDRGTAINASTDPLLSKFRFRSIGPASMGGRIDDIAVSESNPNIIWLGYAVGGAWKSDNNGTTFSPVFDTYTTASIGDIAIHPTNPDIVYIGTGEPNNRQTSSFGDGIYKTTDGGRTFTYLGLRETQTIARIVIDHRNPDVLYVAVPGHLFGPNEERGVYKSTDAGKSWNKVKFIDANTGFTDIAIDPSNSNVLYAASYQRRRSGCCFNGGGPGSGLWKSEDAGRTWTKMSGNGLPPGTYGRIALDVSRSNPNVVYAQIEAGESNTAVTVRAPAAAGAEGAAPPGGGPGGQNAYNWCNNGGPGNGWPTRGLGGQPLPPPAPGAAPRKVPDPDPSRGGLFRSDNGGRSWRFVTNCNSRPMYFSQLRVDALNPEVLYVAGLPVAKSLDGGKTFATLDEEGGYGEPGHVDQHAIWVDPKNSNHLMIGNDGGLNISWDQGKTWDFVNTMSTSLAYVVTADMGRPYYVYTGLQDNGSWGGPSTSRRRDGILNSDWFRIGGGDGFYTAVDPTDFNTVYSESQNGNTNRLNLTDGTQKSIRPRAPLAPGQPPPQGGGGFGGGAGTPNVVNAKPGDVYRFNWNTPFMLSPHNPAIVWLGGNRLFKSYNRGETWVASADLTKQVDRSKLEMMGVLGDRTMLSKNDGVTAYSTATAINESPVMPGVVWFGTDDGLLQVSRDGGVTFAEVGKNLPGVPANHDYWISRIDPSHFEEGTAYVSVDGHRSDDLKPYVFVTKDFGQTWKSIAGNLPPFGNVQVVREDPKNRNLLYAGTEFGLYLSNDGGATWQRFMNGLPVVRVDDILVHPREGDLIVATHGRGLWIADDITPLQQAETFTTQDAVVLDVRPTVSWANDSRLNIQVGGQHMFAGENGPRGADIRYWLKTAPAGDVKITIANAAGKIVRNIDGTKDAGLNSVQWNLLPNPPARPSGGGGGGGGGFGGPPPVEPGTYTVTVSVNGQALSKNVTVLKDEWLRAR